MRRFLRDRPGLARHGRMGRRRAKRAHRHRGAGSGVLTVRQARGAEGNSVKTGPGERAVRQIAFAALVAAVLAVPAKAGSYDELNAGIQLYNLGDCKVAIAEFDKALAAKDLIPDQVYIAHYDRGRAHLALSQFDQAIEDYSASLALRPGETQVLLDRSVAYLDAGKLDQAMSDLDRLVAAHPQLATPYRFRSFVHIKRGEIDKGRDDLKMVLKLL